MEPRRISEEPMRIPSIATCALVVAIGSGTTVSGQVLEDLVQKEPQEIASDQTDFWARTLGLSEEQTVALREVNLRYANDMSVAAKAKSDSARKLATLETLEKERSGDVADLLTPAQRERYDALTEQVNRFVKDRTR
jgi:hypothetical protein